MARRWWPLQLLGLLLLSCWPVASVPYSIWVDTAWPSDSGQGVGGTGLLVHSGATLTVGNNALITIGPGDVTIESGASIICLGPFSLSLPCSL